MKNKVIHGDFLKNDLPDHCADLIIADPPYYKTNGDFDWKFKNWSEYEEEMIKWLRECKRILKPHGSMFWYCGTKRARAVGNVMAEHFRILNELVWDKGESFMPNLRNGYNTTFATCTERIFFVDNGVYSNGRGAAMSQMQACSKCKKVLDHWHDATGLSLQEVVKRLGSTATHFFGFSKRPKKQFYIPTPEKWDEMNAIHPVPMSWDEMKKLLDDELSECNITKRYFDPSLKLQEVLRFSNEQANGAKYGHATVKPEKLTRALIRTACPKGGLIVVPFAGSGTECAMAVREGREFVGYEIEEKYWEIADGRVRVEQSQLKLFI